MMSVIAGSAKSLRLKTPAGNDTRPTTDRIKETLFNMIQNQIPGGLFIDLFSGSGAIGIEALSRGARHAYFVENAKPAIACIQENLCTTHMEDKATLLKTDVISGILSIHEREADVIFMDPPYQAGYEEPVLEALSKAPYVTENTLLIMEADIHKDFSFVKQYGFDIIKEKTYKTNKHVFLEKESQS